MPLPAIQRVKKHAKRGKGGGRHHVLAVNFLKFKGLNKLQHIRTKSCRIFQQYFAIKNDCKICVTMLHTNINHIHLHHSMYRTYIIWILFQGYIRKQKMLSLEGENGRIGYLGLDYGYPFHEHDSNQHVFFTTRYDPTLPLFHHL